MSLVKGIPIVGGTPWIELLCNGIEDALYVVKHSVYVPDSGASTSMGVGFPCQQRYRRNDLTGGC